jgi:hypothetical protein
MEKPEQTTFDFRNVRHLAGVPRYLYRNAFHHARKAVEAALRRDTAGAFDEELWLWMFLGIARQRWRDRRRPFEWTPPVVTTRGAVTARPAAQAR